MKRITTITAIIICFTVLAFLASCSSGGGGPLIRGKLQHNYGQSIDNTKVVIAVDWTYIKADKRGCFYYRTEPGAHTVTAAYADVARGMSLLYSGHINVGDNELVDLTLYLRDSGTTDAWAKYRKGDYAGAKAEFLTLDSGASRIDALNGLGWTAWKMVRDYGAAYGYFHEAVKDVRAVEARIGLCGIELDRVNIEGNDAFGRAYQNMCLALNEPDGFTTLPRHDAVKEGDMWALKALLGYISGNEAEATYILNNYSDLLDNETNEHGKDLLKVLESFMGK